MKKAFQRIAAEFFDEYNPGGYPGEVIFYENGRVKVGWDLVLEDHGVPNQALEGPWVPERGEYVLFEGDGEGKAVCDPPTFVVNRDFTEGFYTDRKNNEIDLKVEICLEEEIEEKYVAMTLGSLA